MKYIIVGSGIAGISAAKGIREYDANGEIIVYSNEFHPLDCTHAKTLHDA